MDSHALALSSQGNPRMHQGRLGRLDQIGLEFYTAKTVNVVNDVQDRRSTSLGGLDVIILEAIMVRDCVMTSDGFDLYEIIGFINDLSS